MHWPAAIQKGKSPCFGMPDRPNGQLCCFAGETLPAEASPDGESILPALMRPSHIGRETLVLQARALSLRKRSLEMDRAPPRHRQSTDKPILNWAMIQKENSSTWGTIPAKDEI